MGLTLWIVLGALWLLAIVPFLALRRRADRHAWPVWTDLLDGAAAAHYDYLREVFRGNAELVREGVELAASHLQRGLRDSARERLAQALDSLRRFSAGARERLAHWRLACRAALALVPLAPLQRGAFRLRTLRRLAALHRAAHLVPVTSGERLRLHLRLLERAFVLVARAASRVARRVLRTPGAVDAPPTWTHARDLAHDFDTLARESLDSAHALLTSAHTLAEQNE